MQRGFTLLEVLIAFAMLAVFLVTFYEAAGAALRLHGKGHRTSRAGLVADSVMSQAGVGEALTIGTSLSDTDDGCAWSMSVERWGPAVPGEEESYPVPVPVKVVVEVTCSETSHADDVVVERVFLIGRAGA